MSFYKYSNVNFVDAAGLRYATLWTDDAIQLASNCIGKVLYINDIAVGIVTAKEIIQPDGTGITLKRYLSDGSLTIDTGDTGVFAGYDTPYAAITVCTGYIFNSDALWVEYKPYFSRLSNTPVASIAELGARHATLWTNDPAVLYAQDGALVGQELICNGNKYGTILTNELFDIGTTSQAIQYIPWYINSDVSVSVNACGMLLAKITFQIPTSMTSNQELQHEIDTVAAISKEPAQLLFSGNTTGFDSYIANSYSAVYAAGHDIADYSTIAQDAQQLWEPMSRGLLGLHINGQYVSQILDLQTGLAPADTFGAKLPFSLDANPWAVTKRLGRYIVKPAAFSGLIESIEFKPCYSFSRNGAAWRISVIGPPELPGFVAALIPMIVAVKSCTINRDLYIDGTRVGIVTTWGSKDCLKADGSPVNFSSYTKDLMSPVFKEYFFEVEAPVVYPQPSQDVIVSLDSPGITSSVMRNGTIQLIGVPPIDAGIDGLVGKRLILNEQFIGIVTDNTLDSITTSLAMTTSIEHIPKSVSGIWRLETLDAVGRYPLCVASQISVCDYPSYPYIPLTDQHYAEDYVFNAAVIKHYPNGSDCFTRRGEFIDERICLGHVLPKWVEHAHLDTAAATFRLAEKAYAQLTVPIVANYVTRLAALSENTFRRTWQYGTVARISFAAFINQSADFFWPESCYYLNVPGSLDKPVATRIDKQHEKYTLVPFIIEGGVALAPGTVVLTPTGQLIADASGHLPVGATVYRVVTAYTSNTGLLTPGTLVISNGTIVTIDADGKVPAGTVIATPAGPMLVYPNGAMLTNNEVYIVSTMLVGADALLPPGSTVLTPSGMVIVDLGMRLPPGIQIATPTGSVTVDAWGHIPAGIIVIDTVLGTAVALADGTLPLGTSVRIVTAGETTVIMEQRLLYEASVVITACAPHNKEFTVTALEVLAPTNGISYESSMLYMFGTEAEANATILERISPMTSFTAGLTSITSPAVTINTSVVTAPKKAGVTIRLKRGLRENLPTIARDGEALVTLDTGELFLGTGTGIRKISDVVVSETEPMAADRSKLWYNPVTNTTAVWTVDQWVVSASAAGMDYGAF